MNMDEIMQIRQELIDNFANLTPEEQQIFKQGINSDYGKVMTRMLPDLVIGNMVELLDEEDQTESALGAL